jgi:outer membrane protein assembly factor BamB
MSSTDPQVPERIGRYQILKKLGQGGMGAVYLAHDTQLDRRVALKLPYFGPNDGSAVLERFHREARAAAALHHPNLCPVYDVGQWEGVHYLTMAFIEGQPLAELLRGGKGLPARQAATLVRKLALALQEAHARGVIHRDLKPANIMIDPHGEPVVMDFGLAQRASLQDARLTKPGTVLGTPAYMAPEQVQGDSAAIGRACDIYSLGVILYELLTGRLPFEGPTAAVLAQILYTEPQPPSTHLPDLDRRLEAVCLRAMAKQPAERYPSMKAFAAALGDCLPGEGQAGQNEPPTLMERRPVVAARRPGVRMVAVLGGLLALALGAALVAWIVLNKPSPLPEPPAGPSPRELALARLQQLLEQPTLDNLAKAEDLLAAENLGDDPYAQAVVQQLKTAVISRVGWRSAIAPGPPPVAPAAEPSLVVSPLLGPAAAAEQAGGRSIFAQARGVLYALAPDTGKVRWVLRVGGACPLPVVVPASETRPETALVSVSSPPGLSALESQTGRLLWQHRFEAACAGRPLLIGRRAYVPTADGRVYEIALEPGSLLGWYELGQPLGAGGAQQEATGQLYLPADRQYVYVLDVERRCCVDLLRSGHAAGSLCCEPVCVRIGEAPAGKPRGDVATRWRPWLLLSQADGPGATKLRALGLPVADDPPPPPFEFSLRGRFPYPPFCDGERLGLVTDAGLFALFGLNQVGNRDPALFAEVEAQIAPGRAGPRRPAQLVHAQGTDFWVLARGELQQLRLGLDTRLSPLWPRPVLVGDPLQAGQMDGDGQRLFVVTQAANRYTCLATAVDANSGAVVWQRQLGLECQGEALIIAGKVLALDAGLSLFLFDPAQHPDRPGVEWYVSSTSLVGPLTEPLAGMPVLVAGADAQSAYALGTVASEGGKPRFVIRRYSPDRVVTEKRAAVPAAISGSPALTAQHVVVPLADGTLWRQPLDRDARGDDGPSWRARDAGAAAQGHVLHLGGDDYLITDGRASLSRLSWPAGRLWRQEQKRKLPAQIIASPALVPPEAGASPPRVAVADSSGTVTLLAGGDLTVLRRCDLAGKITAGPFAYGRYVGCVVDGQRLVWLDPEREPPAWEYTTPGLAIVSPPQRVGNLLVVADCSGRFVGLDLATGRPHGPGHVLRTGAVPAVAPVAFGPDRLFAPLADGTVSLIPFKDL